MKKLVSILTALVMVISFASPLMQTAKADVQISYQKTLGFEEGETFTEYNYSSYEIVDDPAGSNGVVANQVFKNASGESCIGGLIKNTIPWHGYIKTEFYIDADDDGNFLSGGNVRIAFKNGSSNDYRDLFNIKRDRKAFYDGKSTHLCSIKGDTWYEVTVFIDTANDTFVLNLIEKESGDVLIKDHSWTIDGLNTRTGMEGHFRSAGEHMYIDNIDIGLLPTFEDYVVEATSLDELKSRADEYAAYGAFAYPEAFSSLEDEYKNSILNDIFSNLSSYETKSDFVQALSNEASVYADMFTDKYTENFETVTERQPYGLFNINGSSTVVEIASDGSLKLSDNSAMYGGKEVTTPKSIVYELKYKTTVSGTHNIIGIRDNVTDGRPWWYANATSYIEANQWYDVKWHINFTTNKAGLYIKTPDEAEYTCIYDGYNSSVLNNISLTYLYSPSNGNAYYDDIVVKEYNYSLSSSDYTISGNNISGVLETELVGDFLSKLTKSNRKTLTAKVLDSTKKQILNTDTMSEARYLRLEDTEACVELEYTIDVDELYNIAFSSSTSDMENSNLVYGDGFSAKADFTNNTYEKQSVLLILAQYSSDCVLKNVAHSSKDIAAESSGDIIVTPSFDMASGDYIKMYLWNKLTLAPYTIPQNIRTLSDATLFLIGDSIVTDYPAADYPQQGWGYYIGQYLDDGITVENHANGGWTTAHYVAPSTMSISTDHPDVFNNWKENIKKGDYVMISLGINDSGRVDKTAYINYLDTMYTYATSKGAEVLFSTPTIYGGVKDSLDGWTYDTSNAWAARGEVCREFAQIKGALCIPLGAKLSEVYEEMYQTELGDATDNESKIAARNAVRYYFHLYSSNLMDTGANGGFSMTELQLKSHPNSDLKKLGNDPTHYNEKGANTLAKIISELIVIENTLQNTNCSLANRVK